MRHVLALVLMIGLTGTTVADVTVSMPAPPKPSPSQIEPGEVALARYAQARVGPRASYGQAYGRFAGYAYLPYAYGYPYSYGGYGWWGGCWSNPWAGCSISFDCNAGGCSYTISCP